MGQIGQMISAGASLTIAYAERLLKDIPARDFGKFARPGGALLHSNHPAFIFGHLCLYPAQVLQRIGQPPGETAAPPRYEPLFKNGVECQDDPAGTIYPPMDELTSFFLRAQRAAMAAVAAADDKPLLGPNPAEGRMRELFPMLGSVLIFYLDGHVQMHLGQISAWRRAMGLAAA